MDYSFSSDTDKISMNDLDLTSQMSESFFGMQEDSKQFQATRENKNYILKHLTSFINIIKLGKEIVGYAFVIPSTDKLMRNFIDKKINENMLFEEVKKQDINQNNFETLYLCASIIQKDYRRKGLSTLGFKKIIESLTNKRKMKPSLFFWGYSKEGELVAKKLSKVLNLTLLKRAN